MLKFENTVNSFDKALSCLKRDNWYTDNLVESAKNHLFLIKHTKSNKCCPTTFYIYYSVKSDKVTPLNVCGDSICRTGVRIKGTQLEKTLENDEVEFLNIIREKIKKAIITAKATLNKLLLPEQLELSKIISAYNRGIIPLDYKDVYNIFTTSYHCQYDTCEFYLNFVNRNRIIDNHKTVLNILFDLGFYLDIPSVVVEYLSLLIEQLGIDDVMSEINEAIKGNTKLAKDQYYPYYLNNWFEWISMLFKKFPETKKWVNTIAETVARLYVKANDDSISPDWFSEQFKCEDVDLKELICFNILKLETNY